MDIISLEKKKQTLCFVEVKTRRSESFAPIEAAIHRKKRRHIKAVARQYCREKRIIHLSFRYDVIAILLPAKDQQEIRHYPDCKF